MEKRNEKLVLGIRSQFIRKINAYRDEEREVTPPPRIDSKDSFNQTVKKLLFNAINTYALPSLSPRVLDLFRLACLAGSQIDGDECRIVAETSADAFHQLSHDDELRSQSVEHMTNRFLEETLVRMLLHHCQCTGIPPFEPPEPSVSHRPQAVEKTRKACELPSSWRMRAEENVIFCLQTSLSGGLALLENIAQRGVRGKRNFVQLRLGWFTEGAECLPLPDESIKSAFHLLHTIFESIGARDAVGLVARAVLTLARTRPSNGPDAEDQGFHVDLLCHGLGSLLRFIQKQVDANLHDLVRLGRLTRKMGSQLKHVHEDLLLPHNHSKAYEAFGTLDEMLRGSDEKSDWLRRASADFGLEHIQLPRDAVSNRTVLALVEPFASHPLLSKHVVLKMIRMVKDRSVGNVLLLVLCSPVYSSNIPAGLLPTVRQFTPPPITPVAHTDDAMVKIASLVASQTRPKCDPNKDRLVCTLQWLDLAFALDNPSIPSSATVTWRIGHPAPDDQESLIAQARPITGLVKASEEGSSQTIITRHERIGPSHMSMAVLRRVVNMKDLKEADLLRQALRSRHGPGPQGELLSQLIVTGALLSCVLTNQQAADGVPHVTPHVADARKVLRALAPQAPESLLPHCPSVPTKLHIWQRCPDWLDKIPSRSVKSAFKNGCAYVCKPGQEFADLALPLQDGRWILVQVKNQGQRVYRVPLTRHAKKLLKRSFFILLNVNKQPPQAPRYGTSAPMVLSGDSIVALRADEDLGQRNVVGVCISGVSSATCGYFHPLAAETMQEAWLP